MQSRLRTAILVTGTTLGLVLLLAVIAFGQLARYQDEVTGVVFNAVVELEELQSDLVNAESAVRAYGLSGDEELLTAYSDLAYGRPDEVRSGLGAVLPRVPGLDTHFDDLAMATDEWRAGYAKPLIEEVRLHGGGEVYFAWRADGERLFAEVREPLRSA